MLVFMLSFLERLQMIKIATLICASLMFTGTTALFPPFVDPDTGLNVFELIHKYGFPLERHTITTEDGYILETHRIPHGRYNDVATKGVVFVQHGLGAGSASWVNFKNESLAFRLADHGYDVWIGNGRGTEFSRKHEDPECDPNKNKKCYWDISWHEHGLYDIPANIDYILEQTSESQLQYVGHSMGCTGFMVMASSRPEYNDKIKLATLMAPAIFVKHIKVPFAKFASKFNRVWVWLAPLIGLWELPAANFLTRFIVNLFCNNYSPVADICPAFLFITSGFDYDQMNKTMMPVLGTTTPAGAAFKNYLHFSQNIDSGHFRPYDYFNAKTNRAIYNRATPEDYKLENIDAPLAIYYGPNDWLATPEDVEYLLPKLNSTVFTKKIPHKKFMHFDFLFAKDVYELVYKDLIAVMDRYF